MNWNLGKQREFENVKKSDCIGVEGIREIFKWTIHLRNYVGRELWLLTATENRGIKATVIHLYHKDVKKYASLYI